MTKQWTPEVFQKVRDGVAAANLAYTTKLPADWIERVGLRAKELSVDAPTEHPAALNVVLFHIKIPESAAEIQTADITPIDHGSIDYETLIRLNIEIALKTNPGSRVILITDSHFLSEEKGHTRLLVRRINVVGSQPMFERVWAMAAYVESSLFTAPTVFLDSDAFLLRPIHNLFLNDFDVGLTYRDIVGQMPINEGVIFANNKNRMKVANLFRAYLATYLAIESSEAVGRIYQNVRRWRGGQLSVNGVGQGGQVYASGWRNDPSLGRVVFLPCSKYNLSQIQEEEVSKSLRKRCSVLHLKGPRKSWIARLRSAVGI